MAQPRVALFTDTYDEVSGVGKTFRRLADWCVARGYRLDVFTIGTQPTNTEDCGSVRIHRVRPRVPVEYYPGLAFDAIPLDDNVLTYARDHEFDLVHVATPGHMGVTGLYLAARHSLPIVGSYHTELPQYVSQRMLRVLGDDAETDDDAREYVLETSERLTWEFLRRFYDFCALVLVPSEATRASVAAHLAAPLGLFTRGVDTEQYSPAYRQRGTDGPPRLLYVGRLAVEKNLDWLVTAARAHPEWEVEIVGDGPLRGWLAEQLPQAHLAGFLEGEALARAYADADLFAFPSLTETFGNVVLEAQASGLPAVVGHLGGPQEIIAAGETGLVAHDAAEFQAHLEALVADPARRQAYGQAARQRALDRSWPEVFERLWQTWSSIRYPYHRRLWARWLRRMKHSDNPFAVGLVAFWKQFGRRRAAQARARARRAGHE